MSQEILIFLENSTSGHLFVRAARQQGYRPVLLTDREGRYRNLASEEMEVIVADTSQFGIMVLAYETLRQSATIAGILSTSGAYAEMAARLCRRYGLPGGHPDAIKTCQNKFRQRDTLRNAGMLGPQYELVRDAPFAGEVASRFGYPVIVKPAVGSGSTGVRLCYAAEEVQSHVDDLVRPGGSAVASGVLIEEFLEGPEFSVETIGDQVLGITRKHLGDLPCFVEVGHDFPAVLPKYVAASISDTVITALAVLGLGWGPAHTELRLTDRGPTIIEVNPRMGGDMIPELVRLSTGIDAVAQTIKLVTGQETDLYVKANRHASIRFLTPSSTGIVRWQADLEKAMAIADVTDVECYVSEGCEVHLHGDYRDRIGHVIAAGVTQHHVEVGLSAALMHLQYQIDPKMR